MARIRTIKPQFFLNEDLGALGCEWRLLFIGLWTQADRMGILEDRTLRLKALLFPYDDVDIGEGLGCLANAGLITRYEANGTRLIAIPTWDRHQLVGRDEPPSEFSRPDGQVDILGRAPNDTVRHRIYERDAFTCHYCQREMKSNGRARCVDHVIPLSRGGSHHELNLVTSCKRCNATKASRTPDEAGMTWPEGYGHSVNGVLMESLTVPGPEGDGVGKEELIKEGKGRDSTALRARFERFWAAYPNKKGKDAAWRIWERLKPADDLTEQMIAKVHEQSRSTQWLRDGGQYIPHPRTWLNQGRWQDEAVDIPAALAVQSTTRKLTPAERSVEATKQWLETSK